MRKEFLLQGEMFLPQGKAELWTMKGKAQRELST